jgi:two-component system, LytTR family, response regulator
MQMMRVVIADDERLSRRALRAQLEQIDGISVIAECTDGVATLSAIQREAPDLVFLDIEMPRLNGFEVLERLDPGERPAVVFVTAYDEHAIRAFEVRALDYVLKPFDGVRLRAAVEHVLSRRREHELSSQMEHLLDAVQSREHPVSATPTRRLLVRQTGCSFFVPTASIDWVEAFGNYVRLHVGEQSHVINTSMGELERKLDRQEFMRIHRSTIVNLDRVRHVEPYGGSDYQVVLHNGVRLRVSRSCRDRLLKDAG